MPFKKYALPIFLLYIITSVFFLFICSYLYYNNEKQHIQNDIQKDIIHAMREIDFAIKRDKINEINYDEIDDDLDIKINIIENKFMPKSQKDISNKKRKIDKFKINNDEISFKTLIPTREKLYEIQITSKEYSDEIAELISEIVIFSVICIFLFLLISYFIIKLSFRPLLAQIKALNSFITDATHEINTPLSVILMSVEMFETNPKKYLTNIKTASKTISNLYDDLVNLNLKDSLNNIQEISIDELIKERTEYFAIMLKDKNLILNLQISNLKLKTDENKFKKIFDNILSNAIKYCDDNSEITVILTNSFFEIQNIGETISAENQAKIYEKFKRFNKEKGGFGIGLSLVKKYCDELNYTVLCESKDKLTKFKVTF